MQEPYFQLDNFELYHGNSMDILPTIGNVNMAFADPPYFFITAKPSGTFPWIYLVEYSAQPFASALSAMKLRYSSTVNALLESNPKSP